MAVVLNNLNHSAPARESTTRVPDKIVGKGASRKTVLKGMLLAKVKQGDLNVSVKSSNQPTVKKSIESREVF
jgi:hypothetical protein